MNEREVPEVYTVTLNRGFLCCTYFRPIEELKSARPEKSLRNAHFSDDDWYIYYLRKESTSPTLTILA
jgi:hypothetical protein